MTFLSDQTPVQIDTKLNDLLTGLAYAQNAVERYTKLGNEARERGDAIKFSWYCDKVNEWCEDVERTNALISPLHDEFNRRGGWTRFYLVTNSNGHVHWTRACNTCFADTQFAWLTQFSGTSHEDLVELAGEKACTVCFPNAPVDVLKRPSKLTTPEREAREAEKAAKQAEKNAAAVLDPSTGKVLYKTDRGATNDIASNLSSMVGYGPTHPSFSEWQNTVLKTIDALLAKGYFTSVEESEKYYQDALAKARKKCLAEHKRFMSTATAKMWREQGVLDPEIDKPNYTPVKY